jgi:Recombination endonuclease VII
MEETRTVQQRIAAITDEAFGRFVRKLRRARAFVILPHDERRRLLFRLLRIRQDALRTERSAATYGRRTIKECPICDTDEPGGKGAWNRDHDHETGLERGLICHVCNVWLGQLGDRLESVLRALAIKEQRVTGPIVFDQCAVCQRTKQDDRWQLAHTDDGEALGALCRRCWIGVFRRDRTIEHLRRAVAYLRG